MAIREIYKGFSTYMQVSPPYTLVDTELVKQDLMNVFLTRKGERVMRPNFGTRIFDYLMDPFDDDTKDAIISDAIAVVRSDPRVELVSIDVRELDYIIRVDMVLNFRPQDVVENLYIDYDRRNRTTEI